MPPPVGLAGACPYGIAARREAALRTKKAAVRAGCFDVPPAVAKAGSPRVAWITNDRAALEVWTQFVGGLSDDEFVHLVAESRRPRVSIPVDRSRPLAEIFRALAEVAPRDFRRLGVPTFDELTQLPVIQSRLQRIKNGNDRRL